MDEQLSTTETAVRIEECINAFKYQRLAGKRRKKTGDSVAGEWIRFPIRNGSCYLRDETTRY